ncbi:MAG: hypothetical protein IPJ65_15925 [Archangiaceae bacterium]|nr:hypothetical protein [Archangiaceae bacterium]
MSNNPAPNRIDQTPLRLSSNVTIQRQTPKTDFGDRMKSGIDTAAGVVANGAAVVGGIIPGGAIVSAAVSSIGAMTNNVTPTHGGVAVAAQYGQGANGVMTLGGGSGGVNTTSGGGALGGVNIGSTVSSTNGTNYATGGGSAVGDMNQQLIQSQTENAQMMKLQLAMQRENLVFTSVSNVLKTRHDTAKNSISNVR